MADDDWKPILEEIKHKRERNDTRWNALDAKIGVILGFAVVVLFQVILSSDIGSLATMLAGSTAHVALAYIALLLFIDGVISLVGASIVGFFAFRLVSYKEIPLEKWVTDCLEGTMELKEFSGKVAWHLYNWNPINEDTLRRKTIRFEAMFYLFLVGVAFFLARFFVMFILNSVARHDNGRRRRRTKPS